MHPGVGERHLQGRARGRITPLGGFQVLAHPRPHTGPGGGEVRVTHHGPGTGERGLAHSDRSSYRIVDRYRSPKDGMMTTIGLPSFSLRAASCKAASSAAPEEMPTSRPSSVAARRACLTAVWASTSKTSS